MITDNMRARWRVQAAQAAGNVDTSTWTQRHAELELEDALRERARSRGLSLTGYEQRGALIDGDLSGLEDRSRSTLWEAATARGDRSLGAMNAAGRVLASGETNDPAGAANRYAEAVYGWHAADAWAQKARSPEEDPEDTEFAESARVRFHGDLEALDRVTADRHDRRRASDRQITDRSWREEDIARDLDTMVERFQVIGHLPPTPNLIRIADELGVPLATSESSPLADGRPGIPTGTTQEETAYRQFRTLGDPEIVWGDPVRPDTEVVSFEAELSSEIATDWRMPDATREQLDALITEGPGVFPAGQRNEILKTASDIADSLDRYGVNNLRDAMARPADEAGLIATAKDYALVVSTSHAAHSWVAAHSAPGSVAMDFDRVTYLGDTEALDRLMDAPLGAVPARLQVRRDLEEVVGQFELVDARPPTPHLDEIAERLGVALPACPDRSAAAAEGLAQASAAMVAETSELMTEQQEWTVTPTQAIGGWVEQTTRIRTLAATEQYGAAREMLREIDAHVTEFDEGMVPPGSAEDGALYMDAVWRSAIPVGDPPVDGIVESLRADGVRVPDLPDPERMGTEAGVLPLSRVEVEHLLGAADATSQPVGGIGGPAMAVSYEPLGHPDEALVERLNGDLSAYAYARRTGPGELKTEDILGNALPGETVADRLDLTGPQTRTLMSTISGHLDAQHTQPAAEEPATEPDTQISAPSDPANDPTHQAQTSTNPSTGPARR